MTTRSGSAEDSQRRSKDIRRQFARFPERGLLHRKPLDALYKVRNSSTGHPRHQIDATLRERKTIRLHAIGLGAPAGAE